VILESDDQCVMYAAAPGRNENHITARTFDEKPFVLKSMKRWNVAQNQTGL